MEFVDSVNAHYCFPIVGVIVCALLVFAFGFKSPGQPPSFDIVEEERKVSKKRKGKDNQKAKAHQNGKAGGSVLSNKSDNSSHTQKGKVAVEKATNKTEVKSAKKSRSQHHAKQVESGSDSHAVVQEDNNEGGWVQLVSKKERKHRKKDDATPNFTESEKSNIEIVNNEAQPCDAAVSSISSGSHEHIQLKTELLEQKETEENESSSATINVEKETPQDAKVSIKQQQQQQRTPRKKKGKREESSVNLEQDHPEPIYVLEPLTTEKCDNDKKEKNTCPSVSDDDVAIEAAEKDLLEVQEKTESFLEEETKNKSKKKKGKKKTVETTVLQEDNKVDVDSKVELYETETEPIKNPPGKEIIGDLSHAIKSQEINGETDKVEESKELDSAKDTNVAFDELSHLWQDPRPQKKKKKVRREH